MEALSLEAGELSLQLTSRLMRVCVCVCVCVFVCVSVCVLVPLVYHFAIFSYNTSVSRLLECLLSPFYGE